ncbi:hypothetical protein G6011_07159 [Alternaria panax]|uniref:mitogen-activated protein kinase kinase n=1 Tax=Alternaria panax TaxID=48097 RepID=A0AAD4F9H6_9PLEO|nr:hypothetical protein G6011_07159 [Alternaria panax]
MAQFPQFTFPASMEVPLAFESPATLTQKRQQPQLHLLTGNATNKGQKIVVSGNIFSRPAVIRTLSTPPTSPTRKRSMTMGAQDPRSMHNSGAATPPITPGSVSHSKSNSTSSDFLSSLSSLRRGDSISSLSRPRVSLDASPQPGSTELTTFPYHSTEYEFKMDDRGRKKTIGEGAWSDVFLAKPCPPKTTQQSPSQPPCGPEMTPPLTPVRTVDSAVDLTRFPITPPMYAVKVPAMTSAKKVLSAEARILSYLSRFPDAESHIVPFYGLDTRTGSLLLRAMDDTLEGWIQKTLNALDEESRATKLAAVFPDIALTLLKSLQWMQEKFCTHADVKPSNVLVSSLSASIPKPVYTDFSSTILNHPDATIESCASPLGAGTWDYLDPSLLSSSSTTPPSATSDLWSLAITLLFLILGSSPYDAFKGNKYQQREMIKSGCPLQCMRHDDQGIKNTKRMQRLSKDVNFDLLGWFGKVLMKDGSKRVGLKEWTQELEGAVMTNL